MAPNDEPFILIVEDDPDQAGLIQAAFKTSLAHARTHLVYNGLEAQLYLAGEGLYENRYRFPLPSLVVLDPRHPDINGFEALEWMAEWECLAKIPVIVFTSEDPEHERRAYALGVRRYMRKPHGYGELVAAVREELGLPEVVGTTMAVTSGEAPKPEDLSVEPRKAKRLTGIALFSLSLFEMTAIVVAYEAMRYASTTGVVPVPLYVMATSYVAISALVVAYFVTGVQRRRHSVETENERLIVALQRSLAEVDTLSGLLPICAHCKKVKDSEGYWHQIESYISSRSEAVFRHGLCEVCIKAFVPEDADQAG